MLSQIIFLSAIDCDSLMEYPRFLKKYTIRQNSFLSSIDNSLMSKFGNVQQIEIMGSLLIWNGSMGLRQDVSHEIKGLESGGILLTEEARIIYLTRQVPAMNQKPYANR